MARINILQCVSNMFFFDIRKNCHRLDLQKPRGPKMEQEQKPRLIDQLPLKKYVMEYGDMIDSTVCGDLVSEEYIKASDIESFLQKFTKPDVLQKVVKSLMFGQKLDLEEVLK